MDLQKVSAENIVKECVDRYFQVILTYKNNGVKVLVWGPIASWHDSKPYTGGPSFGSNLERNELTKLFNEYIKELCDKNGIGFISIFNHMVNSNNETKAEYLDDWKGSHIHLSQRSMDLILNEFKKQNLL